MSSRSSDRWPSSSFSHLREKGEELLERWKYSVTGLVALVAVTIMTAVVVVEITRLRDSGGTNKRNTLLSPRLEFVLNEISSNIDPSVDPCDDFYEYACGSFSKRHPIPENKAEVSYHTLYSAQVYRTIVDRLQSDQLKSKDTIEPLKYLKRVWDSCVNDDSSTSQQTQKLMQYFEELDRLSWQDQLARLIKDDFDVLFSVKMNYVFNHLTRVVIGPPNVESGFAFANSNPEPINNYQSALSLLLRSIKASGNSKGNLSVSDQTELEYHIFIFMLDTVARQNEKRRNPLAHLMKLERLKNLTKMDWPRLLEQMSDEVQFTESTLIEVEDLKYILEWSEPSTRMEEIILQEYIAIKVLHAVCFFLGEECREAQFQLFQQVQSAHLPKYRDKDDFVEKNCFNFLSKNFQDLIFRVYNVHESSSGVGAKFLSHLLTRLKQQVHKTIDELSWMDEDTKMLAHEIVAVAQFNSIGAPEYVSIDEQLREKYKNAPFINETGQVDALDYFRSISAYVKRQEFEMSEFQCRPSWPISLFSTRPYLAPETKQLFVPDFFASGPFASPELPIQIRLGFFGWPLAHEMIHLFDGVAEHYKDFYNVELWTDETIKMFHNKMQCLVDVYDEQEVDIVWFGQTTKARVNGTSGLNENLADLIALEVALEVLKLFNTTDEIDSSDFPDPLKELADDRLFFLSYANVHCTNQLPPMNVAALVDPPPKVMVNLPLSHTDHFARTFKCAPGTRMNPRKKCSFK